MSEVRMANAPTAAQADTVLDRYREDFNLRFAVAANVAQPGWRALKRGLELERACSFYCAAIVLTGCTVRIGGQVIDIPPGPLSPATRQKKMLARGWRGRRGPRSKRRRP
jgi:hypothetical protein